MKVYLIKEDASWISGGFTTEDAAVAYIESTIEPTLNMLSEDIGYELEYIEVHNKLPRFVSFRYNKPGMPRFNLGHISVEEIEVTELTPEAKNKLPDAFGLYHDRVHEIKSTGKKVKVKKKETKC